MPSLFSLHVQNWSNCQRCEYSTRRTKVCLGRGTVPCDIVFLGEAPGKSEDVTGQPFVGPAGHLMDEIIRQSVPKDVTYALTNLVGCIPLDEDSEKFSEPSDESVTACAPRLQAFVALAKPQLIVCVGSCARDWLDTSKKKHIPLMSTWTSPDGKKTHIPRVSVVHPSHILQSNVAMRGFAIRKSVVTITNAVDKYIIPF
jgi:uracil-DNA glycosylase family 4